jgi:tryptophanyl-tRNA synthetase
MRILSGVQPSGKLHLGNYFGAIRQFDEFQHKGHGLYFIADLHALTTVRDADTLRENCHHVALALLALGLDPEKATIFRQSDIPEVTELTWILSTVTPMGLLERAHSFKDKTARGISPDHGLFAYPVLMASDILIYHSDLVPVGKDQKQHLEITRDIAVKFNQTYCKDFDPHTGEGGVLKLPEAHILEDTAVVPGVDGQKMSKSYGNTIDLFGPEKQVRKRVMGIKTDSTPLEAPKDPDSCNVFALLKLFAAPEVLEEIREMYVKGGTGYGDFKKRLWDYFEATFGEARKRYDELLNNEDYVNAVLDKGAQRAREIATQVMDQVRRAAGLK